MTLAGGEPNLVTLPSGLVLQDVELGEGATAEPGDRCAVYYTGWSKGCPDPFDSTPDRSEPFVFRLAKGDVIDGWVEGVVGMREGGIRRLSVPASLAYGDEGRDDAIPPGADLIFEIELASVSKRNACTHLLISPHARVRWQGRTIELFAPGEPRTVETSDADVLLVLHEFSAPSRWTDVAARFPQLPAEDVEAVVDELEAAHVLIRDTSQPAAEDAPAAGTAAFAPDTAAILFVLPPPLYDLGHLEVPSAFLFLGSLAAQAGLATDFLMASSASTPPSATRMFVGPSKTWIPTVLFLQEFASELLDRITRLRAQSARTVLGLSCFSSALFASSVILGALVRAQFPDLPILIGGCHPTIDPESLNAAVGSETAALQGDTRWRPVAPGLFDALDRATAKITARGDFVFDIVFAGRADESLLPELQTMAREGKRPSHPKILSAAPMDTQQMNAFRYDWPLLSRVADAYHTIASDSPCGFPISFSLGCPYACAFCINSRTRERWQGMQVGHAINTVEFLHLSSGIRRFSLMDANFAANKSWRQEFFAGLAAKPWLPNIHIDTESAVMNWELEDYSVLDHLSLTLQIGVESCAPEMLITMGKCKTPPKYLERLKALIETLAPRVDHISLMLILGYPGETHDSLRTTFDFLMDECRILSHNNVEMCPQLYLPLRGTRAFEQTRIYSERHGYHPSKGDWWNQDAADRFAGLRPSRGLSIETCSRLAQTIGAYYRASANGVEEASSSKPTNHCATLNHSKLEQREFRAEIRRIIDKTPSGKRA